MSYSETDGIETVDSEKIGLVRHRSSEYGISPLIKIIKNKMIWSQ
jgi:hypothetical protein